MMKHGREARGSSGIIIIFTMILVFYVMIQSMLIVDRMEYSEHDIPSWKG